VVALAGVAVFVPLPFAPPVWTIVVSTMLLGAGLGLISTPLVVGVQSSVSYSERGVATGSLMFCRFLGQSLGAAVFGAIVNSTLHSRLAAAPAVVRQGLPGDVDALEPAVIGHRAGGGALLYLREAFDAAAHHVYAGMTVVAVVTIAVLFVCPRRFPVLETAAAAPGPPADGPGAG
jgi:hypothetical protein